MVQEVERELSGLRAVQESLWIFRSPPFYLLGTLFLALYLALELTLGEWGELLLLLGQLLIEGTVIALVEQRRREGQLALGRALDIALWRFPALLGALVLLFIAFGGITFVILLLIRGLAARAIAGLILIPLWLFFILRFALVGPAIIIDEEGPASGYKASWRLTEGQTWRILLILILTCFPFLIIGMGLSAWGYRGGPGGMAALLLGGAAETLAILWSTAALTRAYLQLRRFGPSD